MPSSPFDQPEPVFGGNGIVLPEGTAPLLVVTIGFGERVGAAAGATEPPEFGGTVGTDACGGGATESLPPVGGFVLEFRDAAIVGAGAIGTDRVAVAVGIEVGLAIDTGVPVGDEALAGAGWVAVAGMEVDVGVTGVFVDAGTGVCVEVGGTGEFVGVEAPGAPGTVTAPMEVVTCERFPATPDWRPTSTRPET